MSKEIKGINLDPLVKLKIDSICKQMGFSQWSATGLNSSISLEFYEQWLDQNYHGSMEYLKNHLELKKDPKLIHPRLESAFVFLHPYEPISTPTDFPSQNLRIASYARNEDYHFWLQKKLNAVLDLLKEIFPQEIFISATDSKPVLERDLGYRSGLGWVGKNTCLINRTDGSYFLIGEILTSLKNETTVSLVPDFCGTCQKCIEICPTQALVNERLLDARKCISYWTIESQKLPPETLRPAIQDWFFGCDLCQSVCPWNQKVFGKKLETVSKRNLAATRQGLVQEIKEILSLSGKQLGKKFSGTPLVRARPFGLRRNAIIVATNHKLTELKDAISYWQKDEKLNELVLWSLRNLET